MPSRYIATEPAYTVLHNAGGNTKETWKGKAASSPDRPENMTSTRAWGTKSTPAHWTESYFAVTGWNILSQHAR